jgi:hypothetical protein
MAGEVEEKAPQGEMALAQYKKGMKDLGNGLIALGVFQTLVTVITLALRPRAWSLFVIIGGMLAATDIGLGILARMMHAWVNYVVATLALLLLTMNLAFMGSNPNVPNPGSNLGSCFAIVILAALLYYSINNLQKLRRAKAAGLRP